MHSKSWVYHNLKKGNLWVGTVSMKIKGLAVHKRGGEKNFDIKRGDRISGLKIFKGG